MDEESVIKLSKILKGEAKGTFIEQLLSEIYSEVNQLNQKVDRLEREMKNWQENK